MPAKRFNEADIDFDAIDGELAKLVPPKLSLTDVLDRLRKRLVEQQAKGVTVDQMHEVLKSGGIAITERRSADVSGPRGVLPGRKVAEAARSYGVGRKRRSVLRRMTAHSGFAKARKRRLMNGRCVVAVYGVRIMTVAMGDGRALAWRFSARVRRWREAPSR